MGRVANEDNETPMKALINVNAAQHPAASCQDGRRSLANVSKVSNIFNVQTVKEREIRDVCDNLAKHHKHPIFNRMCLESKI
jgi:hypothetical protein